MYRILADLLSLGFAEQTTRGYFSLRSSVFQPYRLWPDLLPSLAALKRGRHFGRSYNESDVKHARTILQGVITLDYRAYELIQLQTPQTLFVYAKDIEEATARLRNAGFSEGKRGRVVVLPQDSEFDNEIQRVYLDCMAFGGRSILDAIAIDLLYGDQFRIKGVFLVELVEKVREDLPRK